MEMELVTDNENNKDSCQGSRQVSVPLPPSRAASNSWVHPEGLTEVGLQSTPRKGGRRASRSSEELFDGNLSIIDPVGSSENTTMDDTDVVFNPRG